MKTAKDKISVSQTEMRDYLRRKIAAEKESNAGLWRQASQDAEAIIRMIIETFNPKAVYQWGSVLDGRQFSEISDIDIAVLFREPPTAGEATLRYYTRLCDAVPDVERTDFVNLNQANPILAFEALRGRMLCKNDAEATAAFTSLTCREYEDITGYLAYLRRQLSTAA